MFRAKTYGRSKIHAPKLQHKKLCRGYYKTLFLEVMLDNQIVVVLPFSKRQKSFFVLKLG